MIRPFTVGANDDGYNLALGIEVSFDSASDRTAVEDRRRAPRGSVEPPQWKRPEESSEEWAPMVTFTEVPCVDRFPARTVVHPVSSLSPVWGAVEVGSSIIMMLDGRPLGNGTVHWIRPLPPGIQNEDMTRFLNWSGSLE